MSANQVCRFFALGQWKCALELSLLDNFLLSLYRWQGDNDGRGKTLAWMEPHKSFMADADADCWMPNAKCTVQFMQICITI